MRFSQFLLRGVVCVAAFSGAVSAQTIAVLPGAQGASSTISVFAGNPILQVATTGGVPTGAFQLLAKPDGSKYYLLTGSSGITVLDRNLKNPVQILTSLNASPTKAMFSPDGRRLFVIAGNVAYLIDTATDTIINGAIIVTGTPADVAFSLDSQTAYILSNGAFTAYVTPVDLTTTTVLNNLNLPVNGSATAIATGPNGLLYVSVPNGLFEINPKTLLITPGPNAASAATIPVSGTPGKVQFTADGQTAIAVNRTPQSGAAILFNLQAKTAIVATGAGVNGSPDQIVIAVNGRILVHTNANALYELSLGGGFVQSPLVASLPAGSQVISILGSNEAQARTVFVQAAAGGTYTLYRFDLPTNSLSSQVPIPNQGGQVLAIASPNPTSGAASIQAIGSAQTISSGAVSQPLVARVLDVNGVPVFNSTVTFTVLAGGVTLSSSTANTNSDGYAVVYATAGVNPGSYQVQATVAGATSGAPYTINVAGGGTGPGGCTQNCTAAGMFVVSGNGQLISEQQVTQQLLMVVVKDANGNPLYNQQVTFSITQGQGTIACTGIGDQYPYIPTGACTISSNAITGLTSSLQVVTDPTGQAGVKFLGTSIFGSSFAQTTVNATSSVGSVNFTITTVLVQRINNGGQASLPVAYLLTPDVGTVPGYTGLRVLTGTAGQTIPGGIQVQVVAADGPQSGQPIPNVALNVSGAGDPRTFPSATCANGTPLTDSTGVASCDVLLGPAVGTAALSVNVGGAIQTPLVEVVVAQGVPAKINLIQGNNQSGTPGQQFTLRAQITDANGRATPNVPVQWVVSQGIATLGTQSQQSDAQGFVQSTLTLGSNPGQVLVRLTAGSGSSASVANFSLNVTVPISIGAINALSGGGQTAITNQGFGSALVARVTDTNGQPVSGAAVTFSVTSGTAVIQSASVRTDALGNAITTVAAGGAAGPILITASTGNLSTIFALTAQSPGPVVNAGSFRNAASNAPGLTPCGVAIVSGTGLASGIQGTVLPNPFIGPLPLSLSGVSLTVNGIAAPIFWVSNTQQGGEAVAFQTPCEVSAGPAAVVVSVSGGTSTVADVPVTKYQPGIFETVINGQRLAVLQHVSDGSFVTPANPARRGETLKMFVTGVGTGAGTIGTNHAGTGGQASDALLTVGVNNGGVPVIGSEYLPGAVGIYSVTFTVPADTATGTYQNLGFIIADPTDPNLTSIYAPGSFLPIS